MAQRCHQNACRSVAGALVAACVASITLAGCAGGNVLNGHPAPTLSANALDSTATSGSPGTTQSTTPTSGTPSQQVTPGSGTPTQPATLPAVIVPASDVPAIEAVPAELGNRGLV